MSDRELINCLERIANALEAIAEHRGSREATHPRATAGPLGGRARSEAIELLTQQVWRIIEPYADRRLTKRNVWGGLNRLVRPEAWHAMDLLRMHCAEVRDGKGPLVRMGPRSTPRFTEAAEQVVREGEPP